MSDLLNKITSKQSLTNTYTLRWKDQFWWAIFYVDEAHGALSIQSDFGDFSYRWGSPSKPFKQFLAEIGPHYLMDKLSHGNNHGKYFYDSESIAKLKRMVTEKCDEEKKSPEEREEYFDAIETLDGYDCRDSNLFFHLVYTNDELSELFDNDPHTLGECVVTGYSPALKQFCEKIWPSFVAVLKAELAGGAIP